MQNKIIFCLLALLLAVFCLSGCFDGQTEPEGPKIPRSERKMEDYTTDAKGRPAYPGAVLGVDVSSHQGEIDWERVRADGVDFAILRIGYRGNTKGGLILDEAFARNYVGAHNAGLKLGVYFFSQAISETEAREEAGWVLRMLDGVALELPVFFDWEEAQQGRTGGKASSAVGDWALAFCRDIRAGGYQAGVYFSQRYGYSIMHLESLTDYAFWNAEYQSWQSFGYRTEFWQFTGKGEVDGIDLIVDMDLMYAAEEKDEKAE